MTKVMPASQVRADIYNLMDETALTHEPILITGKRNNAVMLSQEDWNAIEETLYLNSIPNMAKSIQEGMAQSDDEFSEDIKW
ncbi:type II toxin-antitoxin system Phd/YefM family antitoxin [Halarcobacter ebronensis]|uniref:Antitoxin n=1 Tax=Halarcobacter ebronensis TaxID=1462615 RepID=A0A4Q1ARW1_9BACT|nr:type II toxin-antitoxin system Phd/YefM family antitoxin [Halarcobacter ebronensis]QKF82790.1 toxin-antitoxin system, antitoxin component, Phd/YefM family [Halarcobacter ebronensis]RXK06814.1 prevent-host-death family protein [Halarcobacter ebronensis]